MAFFILLREAIEAGIISQFDRPPLVSVSMLTLCLQVAVLLGFAEQIMVSGPAPASANGSLYAPIPNKALNTSHERLLRRSEDGLDSYGTAGSRTPTGADERYEETALSAQEGELRRRDVIRRMKFEVGPLPWRVTNIQIWAGALAGGATALALGSAILVVVSPMTMRRCHADMSVLPQAARRMAICRAAVGRYLLCHCFLLVSRSLADVSR